MTTKLTLSVDDKLVKKAKQYAKLNGKSLSSIITEYLNEITGVREEKEIKLHAKVVKLTGKVKLPAKFDYKKELEKAIKEKHG
jgi:Family of unknown function (DUF6364)